MARLARRSLAARHVRVTMMVHDTMDISSSATATHLMTASPWFQSAAMP